MSTASGFSLIELMIVITIISILTAFAIPSYHTYTKRARFAEVISATQVYKIAVALALQQGETINQLNFGKNGIPEAPKATKNLEGIKIKNGVITATATALADYSTYILTPNVHGSEWSVSGTCLKNGLCNG